MRVRIDRGGEAVHVELGGAAVARRAEVAEGVALAYDAAGRIVEVEVRGVDPAALQDFTVYLSSVAERSAVASSSVPAPAAPRGPAAVPPPTPVYNGPVSWDPEAEAAVAQIPFFQRGPTRLAAVNLARKRGLDRVTPEILAAVGR